MGVGKSSQGLLMGEGVNSHKRNEPNELLVFVWVICVLFRFLTKEKIWLVKGCALEVADSTQIIICV